MCFAHVTHWKQSKDSKEKNGRRGGAHLVEGLYVEIQYYRATKVEFREFRGTSETTLMREHEPWYRGCRTETMPRAPRRRRVRVCGARKGGPFMRGHQSNEHLEAAWFSNISAFKHKNMTAAYPDDGTECFTK